MIGDQGVPIGSYTRQLLDALGIKDAVMKNVVSQETDVKGIVAKVALGEADAGFVYVTDAKPVSRRKIQKVFLPAWAQPPIRYQIAIVSSTARTGRGALVHAQGALASAAGCCSGAPASGSAEEALSRVLFAAMTAVAAGVAFAFLLLPLAAIFLRVPLGDLWDQLGNQVFQDALVVSLKTSLIAHVAVLLFGTPTAYLLARKRFFGRGALITLIELPLVLPPAVAGIALLADVRPARAPRRASWTRSGSRSASRRRPSSSPSRSSRAPSTCAGRSQPSKASIRT